MNLNSCRPWSDMDDGDIRELHSELSLCELADYLCRDAEEVQARIAELRAAGLL